MVKQTTKKARLAELMNKPLRMKPMNDEEWSRAFPNESPEQITHKKIIDEIIHKLQNNHIKGLYLLIALPDSQVYRASFADKGAAELIGSLIINRLMSA